jgi:uncharacterized OsmC-like protein
VARVARSPERALAARARSRSEPLDKSRLARIEVEIDLGRTPLDEAGRAALLAYAERCKIHNTLKAACPVSVMIVRSGGS